MSHVDEGTLHAYLDGELPSAERTAIEAHLADCATCRANLTEERALRERATAVLGSARPAERPAPPLEQLRREPQRSPWRVRRSFAWAASIALALGIGYYLRNPAARVTPESPAQPVVVAQNRAVSTQEEKAPPRALPLARQDSTSRRPARADEVAVVTERDSAATRVARRSNEARSHPGPPSTVAAALAPRPADSISVDAAEVSGAVAHAERDRPVAGAASIRVDGVLLPEFAATSWPVINRRVAKSILGEEPVGLPGLATRNFRRGPGKDGTVVVEQALDSYTVIQILQRPAGNAYLSDSSGLYTSEGRTRERADRLARFVKGLRVEITGPLSADSLNRLLEQVAPLP